MLKDRRIGRWLGPGTTAAGFRSAWAFLLGTLFFDFINVFVVQTDGRHQTASQSDDIAALAETFLRAAS